MGIIYKIVSPTKRIYIGQTKNVNRRISDYKALRCKGQKLLYKSLKKYGFENHIFTILEDCIDVKLDFLEKYYITSFNSCVYNNKRFGLNIQEGGRYDIKNKKYKKSKKKNKTSSIKIYQYSLKGKYIKYWSSITKASLFYNINNTNISNCINNKQRSAAGFIWSINKVKKLQITLQTNKRPVIITNKLTNKSKQFDSISDCCRFFNIPNSKIYDILKGIRKHYKNHVVRYIE